MSGVPISAQCVVVGGGPAGIMAGFLLARAGVEVVVLEKHRDFLRDFRGDTIHPSTLDVIAELGLLDEFLERPHQRVQYAEGELGGTRVRIADFTHLPTRCKFVAFMPQWEFLNFIAEHARRLPNFRLMMSTEATGLVHDGGRVAGVSACSSAGDIDLRADLVIGADGRRSRLREAAGLAVTDLGAPMDVLWFKLPYDAEQHHLVLGRFEAGQAMIMLDRGDYWQCALIIRKGTMEDVMSRGIEAFRARVACLTGRERLDEPSSFDDVKLLTVKVDRLEDWSRSGLLFIGDAAHAMSPAGGVGINLAVQDAVAAANLLAEPLRGGRLSLEDLQRVQRRRMFPTRATQALQVAVQNRVIDPLLRGEETPKLPAILKLMQHWTWLQRLPARIIGMGFRPEHVRSPEVMTLRHEAGAGLTAARAAAEDPD
ncbi:MAG TPA: FAD-dependent oxidoreductase [Gammaproteobacteria bacterium]|nr:FAD-dependent oxidoreductase [Gammaproteobacteria bacterium]